jgi:hypothetical protein
MAPSPRSAPLLAVIAGPDELCDGEYMGCGVCGRVLYGGYGDVDCGVVVCWYTGTFAWVGVAVGVRNRKLG